MAKLSSKLQRLRTAALSQEPVFGWTHNFYRYPARFSPAFAAAAIGEFSSKSDLILDPFVGGGTTAVEALAAGRDVLAADINSLAVFIARVKTTPINRKESDAALAWAHDIAPRLHYWHPRNSVETALQDRRTFNLSLPRAKPIKKAIAIALSSLTELNGVRARDLARCILLRTSQWALDNRKRRASLGEFRQRFLENAEEMVSAIRGFSEHILTSSTPACQIVEADAAHLASHPVLQCLDRPVDLVVASPPYPGIHMLYHRWQVDGRRETPAPYWIADCNDGRGTSYYTFGDRRCDNLDAYFGALRETLLAIRSLMRKDAILIQMVSFSDRQRHLRRYLSALNASEFEELPASTNRRARIWRDVPNRKWHATFKGRTNASREVVLVHRAV